MAADYSGRAVSSRCGARWGPIHICAGHWWPISGTPWRKPVTTQQRRVRLRRLSQRLRFAERYSRAGAVSSAEQRQALAQIYDYVARSLFFHDKLAFRDCVARLYDVEPVSARPGRRLRGLRPPYSASKRRGSYLPPSMTCAEYAASPSEAFCPMKIAWPIQASGHSCSRRPGLSWRLGCWRAIGPPSPISPRQAGDARSSACRRPPGIDMERELQTTRGQGSASEPSPDMAHIWELVKIAVEQNRS